MSCGVKETEPMTAFRASPVRRGYTAEETALSQSQTQSAGLCLSDIIIGAMVARGCYHGSEKTIYSVFEVESLV